MFDYPLNIFFDSITLTLVGSLQTANKHWFCPCLPADCLASHAPTDEETPINPANNNITDLFWATCRTLHAGPLISPVISKRTKWLLARTLDCLQGNLVFSSSSPSSSFLRLITLRESPFSLLPMPRRLESVCFIFVFVCSRRPPCSRVPSPSPSSRLLSPPLNHWCQVITSPDCNTILDYDVTAGLTHTHTCREVLVEWNLSCLLLVSPALPPRKVFHLSHLNSVDIMTAMSVFNFIITIFKTFFIWCKTFQLNKQPTCFVTCDCFVVPFYILTLERWEKWNVNTKLLFKAKWHITADRCLLSDNLFTLLTCAHESEVKRHNGLWG